MLTFDDFLKTQSQANYSRRTANSASAIRGLVQTLVQRKQLSPDILTHADPITLAATVASTLYERVAKIASITNQSHIGASVAERLIAEQNMDLAGLLQLLIAAGV